MSIESVKISQRRFTCFCCGQDVYKGSAITRVIENTGMELRPRGLNMRPTYTNARWVHAWCLPRYNYTEHFYDSLCALISECEDEEEANEIEEMLRDHKYWKDEKIR